MDGLITTALDQDRSYLNQVVDASNVLKNLMFLSYVLALKARVFHPSRFMFQWPRNPMN